MFFGFVALLYYLCALLLVALTGFVLGFCPPSPHRRAFCLLAMSLLVWQLTLFLEVRIGNPAAHLWLGRVNFAAVVWAAYLCPRFAGAVAGKPRGRFDVLHAAGAFLLFALTLLTPLVCAAEHVQSGRAETTYGVLFPAYLVYVLGCTGWAAVLAFREWARAADRKRRWRLALIGTGIITTGSVSAVTNALLPFAFGDFGFGDAGPLSVCLFALAVVYAVFFHGLFDTRVIVRETLVYGMLLAGVLGAYSSAVFVVTQYLTGEAGADRLVQFVVLFIAFSFDPLRRFLETKVDTLLFRVDEKPKRKGSKRDGRKERQGILLSLLFPWRRG